MWTHPLASDDGRRGRATKHIGYVIAVAGIVVLCLPLALLAWLWVWALHGVTFPSADQITSQRVIALEAADGEPLLPKGVLQLPPIPVEKMPAKIVDAVLSIEDRRFYQRGPIDVRSILRALVQNLEAGHVVSGGSTITQQLAKILYLGPERTYKRKIQEAALAIWLENHLTKNQILTSYLNNVYLGSGATGFPAAAKLYFGKNVSDLNLAEAAMLAGMINAPGEDDPLRNLLAARLRAGAVIDAMVANGKISQASALEAKLTPATPDPAQLSPPAAGWFADWAYRNAAAAVPRLAGAVTVRTTLDLRLQELALTIIKSTLASEGRKMHATQAALVAMRPDGDVVAMVGGRDYSEGQFNRAVQAKRQPGSAFKLFDYYAALRHGYTPDDTVLDEPVDIKGWEPEDYARHYHGRVTLAEAFAHSYNDAAVRLAQDVGIPQVIAAARDLGLHARLGNNPSLALGTSEVTLLDLTRAYAAVRAGVAPVEPWGIASVSLSDKQPAVPVGRPHEPQHSLGQYRDELIELLRGVVEHGTGHAATLPGFAAGKTGTAQDYRDAWFIGFNDSLVVGVWVGNDDHSPMRRVVGGSLPATIWKQFMEQANPAPSPAVVAQQQPEQTIPPALPPQMPPTSPPQVAEQQPQPPKELFNQSTAGAANAKCDIPVCERFYHSFRASDCTYQPYEGGPRRFCDRQGERTAGVNGGGASEPPGPTPSTADQDDVGKPTTSGEQPRSANGQKANSQKTSGQASAQDTGHDNAPAASAKCNATACQHYSSFRASDCTYQPYGGGPRRVCGGQGERTASTPRREREAPPDQDLDDHHTDSVSDSPDGDGPLVSPPVPYRLFAPLFDLGNHD
jgi:penicillin-binding protein 1A